ncbi:hypothetical protein [Phytohabitans kaempferiae]|uniref:Uncharacterized protein n=1 Tax=Phytohabitans kaempferiae TaxID=1620943 RepID=A0ABV6LZY1_9ACTN
MEVYTIERPSALPAVCAPVSAAARAFGLGAADFPQLTQVHQVQADLVQADLVRTEAWIDGGYGISGLTVKGVSAMKRQDVRGVPPRGRPV